jgi:uncharacterized protein with FMN-binding domain
MRSGAAFLAGAGSAAIIAIGWQAGAGALTQNTASSSTSSSTTSSSSSSASSSTSSSKSSSGSSSASGINGTFKGQDVAEQQWGGDVQVEVVIKNGKITAVNTLSCNASHGADQACPMLAQEVVSAQSANVSTIGRATYTSQVYLQSVQSALDAAGFKG